VRAAAGPSTDHATFGADRGEYRLGVRHDIDDATARLRLESRTPVARS